MPKYTVVLCRRECAEMEIEANSRNEAKQIATATIENAACIADLDVEWESEGNIVVEVAIPFR